MAIAHLAAVSSGDAWVSAIEHPCMLSAVRRHFTNRNWLVPVRASGVVEVTAIRERLRRERPAFLSVMAANNETGVLQPWSELRDLCAEFDVPFFCDAAQWIGKLPLEGMGNCQFVSGCGHKFGGPQGVGFLKCPLTTKPLITGGVQEEGRRAGTENVAGVLAMVEALRERQSRLSEVEALLLFRLNFEQKLKAALPQITVLGAEEQRLWNTVSVVMPELDCRQRWVVKLDKLGFAVSTGSACASGKEELSHVIATMGFGMDVAGRVLRFSSGWETTEAEWNALLQGIHNAKLEISTVRSRWQTSLT
jgi:cysteine desulfurase